MEMYANGSSFGASLTLQNSNSFRDVSFSSYLNQAEEHMIRKITNQAADLTNNHHYHNKPEEEDDELGIFGAEKYFKGEIEDMDSKVGSKFIDDFEIRTKTHQNHETIEQFDHRFDVKLKSDQITTHTPSVQSNVSCNSRVGLLPRSNQASRIIERRSKIKTRTFLARFGCNCFGNKSTQISEKSSISKPKPHMKTFSFDPKTASVLSKLTEIKPGNDCFSFPGLNNNSISSSNSNSRSGNLAGKVVGDDNNNTNNSNNNNNGGGLSLGKKLSLLNDWDLDIPTEDEMYNLSSGMYNHDVDSDSSSDLFEIESFSTTRNNSFIDHRKSNCYAPSEVSVDWSVVTASAADLSVVSDYEEPRTGGGGGSWRISGRNDYGGGGILSGCVSQKAVRVAGDGGGAVGGRRRLSESMAVGFV